MNKFLFLLLVSLPTLSHAGKDVCEFIVDEIAKERPYGDIVDAIKNRNDMDLGGATDIQLLVTAAGIGGGLNGNNKELGLRSCSDALLAQSMSAIQRGMKNRDGRSDKAARALSGGGVGGAIGGSVGEALHEVQVVDMQDESRGLRQPVAFSAMGGMVGGSDGGGSGGLSHEAGALTECDILADTQSCSINPNFTVDSLALDSIQTLPSDMQQCMCLNEKAKKEFPNEQERVKAIEAQKDVLKKMVIGNFGRKFINDYAAHLEDVRFFTVTSKQAFSSDPKLQAAEAEKVRCSKQSDFKDAIVAKCGGKISDSQMKSKLDSIFSLLGQKANGLDYLDRLGEKVMVNTNTNGRKFERSDFDIIRHGLIKSDATVRFADNLISELLKDDDAVKEITAGGKMPYEGFMRYVSTQLRTNKSRFIKRYLNEEVLGKNKYQQVAKSFNDTQVALASISQSMDYAMEVHPGFENLMRKNDLFKETGDKIKSRSNSAIDTIENTENLMNKRFAASCEKLKSDLAEAVCVEESEILHSVAKNELRHTVKESGMKDNLLLLDQAICQDGASFGSVKAFEELSIAQTDRKADILERLNEKDVKKHANLFSKIMLKNNNPNDDTTRFIARAAEEGYRNSRGIEGDKYGSKFKVADAEKISFVSPEVLAEASKISAAKDDPRSTSSSSSSTMSNEPSAQMSNPTFANSYSSALKDYQENTSKAPAQEKFDARNELKEFLSNKENKESVEKLMRDTDDSRVSDLARLREESERNREEMLKLATENEKIKLRQMQDQLAELEQKRAQAVTANVAPAEEEETSSEARSSGRGSRDIASVSSGESSGVNSGSFSGGKSGGSAGGSGSSSAINNARNELSNGLTGNESAGSEPVVISNAVARTGALEIKSTELSKEILNFLETEPDVQTLIKMRQSGMIYKYKVMENGKEVMKEITIDYTALTDDVKKLIEQKIADSGKAGSEAKRLSSEIRDLRRTYSYNALKVILGEQIKAKR